MGNTPGRVDFDTDLEGRRRCELEKRNDGV